MPNEYIYSKSTEKLGKERRFAKQKAVVGIGEMIEIAVNERRELPIHKEKNKTDARFAVRERDGDHSVYAVELDIRHDNDGRLYLYDIQGVKKKPPRSGFRSIRANQIYFPKKVKRSLTVPLTIH